MGHTNTGCGLKEESLGLKKTIRIVTTLLPKNLGGLDVRGSVHHSINHIEITNKMQPCTRIYYSNVYQLLNMFRATQRSSSGAQKL